MTQYLSPDEALQLSEWATGTPPVVGDYGLFYSAVARPQAEFFGQDAYPTLCEKAAALLHSLSRNHALIDGNKRTAWMCTVVFLDLNGVELEVDDDTAEAFILAVATGELDEVGEIAKRLSEFVSE